jgi:hypothetical protein
MTIAAAGVIVAGMILMTLTSPEPNDQAFSASTSTSTTTTSIAEIEPLIDLENFSVEQISRGEPLQWESTLSVVEGYPIALLQHRDMIYAFATNTPNFSSFDSGGLRAWRSRDGLTWESLGEVIAEGYVIASVTSTDQGLMALETNPDGPGFTVWHSTDGSKWEPDEVIVEDLNELTSVYPYATGATDDLLVVAGTIETDVHSILEEKLGDLAAFGWGTDVVGNEVSFTLYGPLGSPLTRISAEELGLDEEERQMILDTNSAANDATADVWVKVGAAEWQRTTIPNAHWIDSFTTTPDGDLVAHGWRPANPTSWTTSDGLEWQNITPSTGRYVYGRWGDLLVAQGPNGGMSVLVSAEGQDWEEIGPAEHFPREIDWWVSGLAAGPGGIAVTVAGWDPTLQQPAPEIEPASISGEDGTLIIDFETGEYRLETADDTHTWSITGATMPGVEVDLDRAMVRFSEPETDETMAEFPLEEVINAEDELVYVEPPDSGGYDAFAFTPDGVEWTIQTLDDVTATDFYLLAVTDTHVIATGLASGGYFNSSSAPGFGVWTAAIP